MSTHSCYSEENRADWRLHHRQRGYMHVHSVTEKVGATRRAYNLTRRSSSTGRM